MKYYTYILRSDFNGSYYVGSCGDLNVRLKMHNGGLVRSTKRYVPWRMVYFEEYSDLSFARKRELKIKSWKKRSMIEKLINTGLIVQW